MGTLLSGFGADFLGQPVWLWLAFIGVVVVLLAVDLGVLHRDDHVIEARESLLLSAGYVGMGLAFGAWVWWYLGPSSGMEYLTGFLIEKTLAMDNVFVIAMIFAFFAVPLQYQHRVLFWGVLGVIVLRAVMIGVGATVVSNFGWVLYLFGAFLLATGVKMCLRGRSSTSRATRCCAGCAGACGSPTGRTATASGCACRRPRCRADRLRRGPGRRWSGGRRRCSSRSCSSSSWT